MSLKTMYGAARKPRPFKAAAANFDVFPQAVRRLRMAMI
jgi:hypothetical protein